MYNKLQEEYDNMLPPEDDLGDCCERCGKVNEYEYSSDLCSRCLEYLADMRQDLEKE